MNHYNYLSKTINCGLEYKRVRIIKSCYRCRSMSSVATNPSSILPLGKPLRVYHVTNDYEA